MNISIIGCGYVGLVIATGLASLEHSVVCIDKDRAKVDSINQGKSPIHEEDLDELLSSSVIRDKRLSASSEYGVIPDTAVTLICVGTGPDADGNTDLTHIRDAARELGEVLANKEGYHVVAVKSTVTPGATEQLIIPLLEKHSGKKLGQDLGVAVNPEFLQEGQALRCFLNPDRTIIGESDERAGDVIAEIYRRFSAPVVRTNLATAEMIKYASNAFLTTKISFINEIGNICQNLGIDVHEVARGMGHDPRIGSRFLNAGVGFGGSCLPKDLRTLIDLGKNAGYRPRLLESVLELNSNQAIKMVEIAEKKLEGLKNRSIAVLGLSFKPGTDDVRDAPALKVIEALLNSGAAVKTYDPIAIENAKQALPASVEYFNSAMAAVREAECVLVLTEWDEFKNEELYRGKTVIDGRGVLDPRKAEAFCDYHGISW